MPYRELVDDGGVWIVFGTQPRSGANVRPQYASGWLSFHRGAERRRLAPIPSEWDAAGDDQLRLWLRSSEVVAKVTEDDEARTSGMAAVSEGRADAQGDAAEAQGDAAEADTKTEEIPHAASSSPAGAGAGISDQDLRSRLERIREMLGSIRGDIG